MSVERLLAESGLTLPPAAQAPPGLELPFVWVRVHGNRAYASGHGALGPDGTPAGPYGRVPSQVTLEEAQESARLATLSLLGDLRRALGDLGRITAWLSISGFVNADPGFPGTTRVLNPCSDLVLSLFGPEAGAHARTAIGVNALPLDLPVIIAAEVEIAG
ncbi:enamine deaminase RidA (YjgF/YER057c/UK114 family) [Streptomyces sp. 1114.5]|uniref:RidA family protein n=1 Tax=unclassified Streptomyces TaxID=2593676 RepID=UPI000BC804E9|nr:MULTISPECIES: RidA family protein [unclassified Streptomyces]RKT09586.1 enamine deaminase RidA (YjgF/YER057c/UK114 family) [Streptomyces sp. 1114.5]SOB88407.1 Enamine deaminase RidA, house cleaning of reactive enamine intermediates, YjgF/YER057c/UK114 family [Streptomyces sp. 1331.2]SOB89091.1 Enamine deaminase RidA, house cleaning of reactive enamine intermediates, YjgF/YER057c/UK114 family [Streptomyces sp. 1331.2]